MNDISTRQNQTNLINLLKAQRVAYSKCKKYQTFDTVSIIIALITPIIGFANSQTLDILSVFGAIWTILYLVFDTIRKRKSSLGAKIQEQFDTELFNIGWNKILCREKVDVDTTIELFSEYKKNDLFNWYSTEITPDLEKEISIILCQRINLSWDNILKFRYSKILLIAVILFYTLILITSLCINYGIFDILKVTSPTIPFLIYGVQNFYNIKSQRETKKQLIQDIDQMLEDYKNTRALPQFSQIRNIQDVIFNERNTVEKTPDWFYKIYKQKFEDMTDETIKIIKTNL